MSVLYEEKFLSVNNFFSLKLYLYSDFKHILKKENNSPSKFLKLHLEKVSSFIY